MAIDTPPVLRIEVPAETAFLRTIRAVVRAYCREVDRTDDVLVRGLLVAVTEVSNNAILAQRRRGSDEPLTVECDTCDGWPRITVVDHGDGFDRDTLEVVLAGDRVDEGSGLGLGLQLSRSFVSDLSIDTSPDGSRVSVTMASDLAA